MKLVNYFDNGSECIGVLNVDETWVFPITAEGLLWDTLPELICNITPLELESLDSLTRCDSLDVKGAVPITDVKLLSPIPVPAQDIICMGINYASHASEAEKFTDGALKKNDAEKAIYFGKRAAWTVGPDDDICAHQDITSQLDYEAELAVIIGKDAKNVAREDVKDYVFGYTIMNDVTARDLQTDHQQWYFGKSLDDFTPLGPCILTVDSVEFPPKLDIRCRVNGELRQDSNTSLLINGIEDIICELSSGMTLKAGSIIATGTPAGPGMGFEPPKFLKPGDVVECYVEGIGTLKNTIVP